jgi:hypothetical protein
VLILAAIVLIAGIVQRWPATTAPLPAAAALVHEPAARPVPDLVAPAPSARQPITVRAARPVPATPRQEGAVAVTPVATAVLPHVTAPHGAVAEAVLVAAAMEPLPVLPSRRIEVLPAPISAAATESGGPAAQDDTLTVVELPAVVVTRAVTVAGRGIRTGIRATSAAIRAAF